MGNSSSVGKHKQAQSQPSTHHPHGIGGVTGAQGGKREHRQSPQHSSAQQIRTSLETFKQLYTLLKQTNMKTRPAALTSAWGLLQRTWSQGSQSKTQLPPQLISQPEAPDSPSGGTGHFFPLPWAEKVNHKEVSYRNTTCHCSQILRKLLSNQGHLFQNLKH